MCIQIANPFHQQHPTPNLLIKLQLGLIGNFGGSFGAIMADRVPSGPPQPAPDGFPDLRRPHESSGAYLGACFRSFSREV